MRRESRSCPKSPVGGAVTGSSAEAVEAGIATLGAGGNAVDAAVAAGLASCAADPCNTGIGGYGGHMVVRAADGGFQCVDFNMWAPPALATEALRRPYPDQGPEASCVPNVVAGLARALAELGSIGWAAASAPAIGMAGDGVVANDTTARAFAGYRDRRFVAECFEIEERGTGAEGSRMTFRQPALARTLEAMAEYGPGWFYDGPLAAAACARFKDAGVPISADDWAAAPASVTLARPPQLELAGKRIVSAPLGTSGSACMFATVAACERVAGSHGLAGPSGMVGVAELMAATWQFRFATPDGNDFDGVAIADWVARALAHPLAATRLAPAIGHTCHLNVMDAAGAAVALTFTHGPRWFGGAWAIPDSGVVMNGGMHLFNWQAPVAKFGRAYAVTNMAPALVEDAAAARIAIGCPGARRIPSIVGLALGRHLFGDVPLQAAVGAGRFHAEDARTVSVEAARLDRDVRASLAARFRQTVEESWRQYYGPLTAIRRQRDGRLSVALDDRETPGFGRVLA